MDTKSNLETLFSTIKKEAARGVWMQAVNLARTSQTVIEKKAENEIILKIHIANKPVSPKVSLWPEDEDWFCDCNENHDPCTHTIAAIINLKAGNFKDENHETSLTMPHVCYHFTRKDGGLSFHRTLAQGGIEKPLNDSLVNLASGVLSGRIKDTPVSATKADYAVEAALLNKRTGVLESSEMEKLIPLLSECTNISLDNMKIRVAPRPLKVSAQLIEENGSFILKKIKHNNIIERFNNGVVICEDDTGYILCAVKNSHLTIAEKELIEKEFVFNQSTIPKLVSDILPDLKKKIDIKILTNKLPEPENTIPYVVIKLDTIDNNTLSVTPIITYGTPPIAEIIENKIHLLDKTKVPIRNYPIEKQLNARLQNELHLQTERSTTLQNTQAIDFTLKLKDWHLKGNGKDTFTPKHTLIPKIDSTNGNFIINFNSTCGSSADSGTVFRAWRENQTYVPLIGGGWAKLPKDFLNQHAERILEIIASKNSSGSLPPYMLPEITNICDDISEPYPDTLKNLKNLLNNFKDIPSKSVPSDLTAHLRSYQQTGLNWLAFLEESQMGAMLADDMGLGKTLQALCAIKGQTLVVAPTSVLQAWVDQIKEFRPGLTHTVYYGKNRTLDKAKQITLTTYAILRLDKEILSNQIWDTIILDEAQIIKNPDSQVAKAAHGLKGNFRITLSGTPIENKLDDLWSQFHFLNPYLLGSRETFHNTYVIQVAKGDTEATRILRNKIKPFILRRLKKDVAPELPPKTEITLHAELNETEREIYESILASSRLDVIEKLETGGSAFAALELLLRLRQASSHSGLIPGQTATGSSKIELLLLKLENMINEGHKGLIFSQWTSFLDLIEPHISGYNYLRLDGTTQNRKEIVDKFQNDPSVPILLMSLKAGGVGLNLTAADHVFLMDPWWNPSVEKQAMDRTHRIGQENPVIVHRIVAKDTVEDKILLLQKEKNSLSGAVLEGNAHLSAITKDDILNLLK